MTTAVVLKHCLKNFKTKNSEHVKYFRNLNGNNNNNNNDNNIATTTFNQHNNNINTIGIQYVLNINN